MSNKPIKKGDLEKSWLSKRQDRFIRIQPEYHLIVTEGYEKNRVDMFDILLPSIDVAIANSKKLDVINGRKPPSKSGPGTRVYEMMEKLKPYFQ
jgi:hypothetical protein